MCPAGPSSQSLSRPPKRNPGRAGRVALDLPHIRQVDAHTHHTHTHRTHNTENTQHTEHTTHTQHTAHTIQRTQNTQNTQHREHTTYNIHNTQHTQHTQHTAHTVHKTHNTEIEHTTYTEHTTYNITHTHTHSPGTLAAPEAASYRMEDTVHRQSTSILPEKPLRLAPLVPLGWSCPHVCNAGNGDPLH